MPSGDHSHAVTLEEFSARLSALKAPRRFAIAISGGRDSMALAQLAAAFARDGGAKVFAFTVDHGLRSEAAEEAAKVADWCAALDLHHETLVWRGQKPTTGVQAAARSARYRLLATAAAKADCAAILTAHNAYDQAETAFMRLARGAGAQGLAAMAEDTKIAVGAAAPLRLLRPLLCYGRERLTATVNAAGQAFVDDPSNDDPHYERVRTRALLAALGEQNLLTVDALNRSAGRLGLAAARLRLQEDDLFAARGGCFYAWGGASIDNGDDHPALGGVGARLIHAVSGEAHGPDPVISETAIRDALRDGAATLGGALIKRWRQRLWFLREPGAVLGRADVAPLAAMPLGGDQLWDGRFIFRSKAPDRALMVRPIGDAIGPLGAAIQAFSGPREAISSSPGIYQDNALIAAPAIPFMASGGICAEALAKERFVGGILRF